MLKPVVNIMVKAARAGGNELLRHMTRLDALNVIEKERLDYASEVDEKAEAAIVKELRRAYPDYAILGEEGGEQKGHRAGARSTFVIDPLRNELFTASKGSGAVLNDHRIRVSERKDLAGALLSTGFPPRERTRAPAQLDCIRELMRDVEDIRRTGSAALDLAYVACGRTDGYFEAGVKPWDIAAGMLLVREAGGRVTDFRGAATGPVDARGTAGRPLLAANLKLGDALQKVIASSGYAKAFNA